MNKLLFIIPTTAVLITSCGGGGPSTGTPGQAVGFTKPVSINGTIQNYTRGTATIDLLANQRVAKSANNPALASTTVNANGAFTLGLPSVAAITPEFSAPGSASDALYTEPGCNGVLSTSVPEAQGYALSMLNSSNVIYNTGISNVDTQAGKFTGDGNLWFYTTKGTSFGGSLSCTATNGTTTTFATISANAPLTVGWNLVNVHIVGTLSNDQKSFTLNMSFNTVNDHATTWSASTVQPLAINPMAVAVANQIKSFRFGALHF